MSIEGKHAYRFGYLKSEQWSNVRLEALVREKAKCQICGEESISNDAHHIWYPDNIYETTERHLAILCRPCHDFVHVMLPDCKTNDEELGLREWQKLRNAIIAWRREKISLFHTGMEFLPAPALRQAYESLKEKYNSIASKEAVLRAGSDGDLSTDQEHQLLTRILAKWWKERKRLTKSNLDGNGEISCGISAPSQRVPE